MLLTADIGNTAVHYGLFRKGVILRRKRVRYRKGNIIIHTPPRRWKFDAAVMCSVVPGAEIKTSVPLLFVTHKLRLGLRIRYKKPAGVGADRIANAVAAKNIYGYPAIIVDFGTAVTIDAVSVSGDYEGGVIVPGLDMIRCSLYEQTSLLPLAGISIPERILGRTTKEAVQSGMYYGVRGMIREIINGLKNELKFPPKTAIIVTGGYAERWGKGIGTIDRDLTLKGLRLIYEKNRDNRSAFICNRQSR